MLDISQSPDQIHLLAELGIAIPPFLVGIKLNAKLVRTLGTVALTTGLGQVAFTAGIGFLLCLVRDTFKAALPLQTVDADTRNPQKAARISSSSHSRMPLTKLSNFSAAAPVGPSAQYG